MSQFVGSRSLRVLSASMRSQPEDVFRLIHKPERLPENSFFRRHFADIQAFRRAICSFATRLSEIDSAVLLQCDLGGRGAGDVGREIGLSRRQIQRRRKAIRAEFVREISGGTQRARESATALRSEREPAKVTAARLHISVRTLWRERKRMLEAAEIEEPSALDAVLYGSISGMEGAWLVENYAAALSEAERAITLADTLPPAHRMQCGPILYDTYGWAEVIQRTCGDARLADDLFRRARAAARHCEVPHLRAQLSVGDLRRGLMDPARYSDVYHSARRMRQRFPHPLVQLSVAEVLNAWNAADDLMPVLRELISARYTGASRHDVARMHTAVLSLCLHPEHERLGRRCIDAIHRRMPARSRSALLATAYESYFDWRARMNDVSVRRLEHIAAHFRNSHLYAETATVLFLWSKTLIEGGTAREAGEAVEEALELARGRTSAKLYADLLGFASTSMGGSTRARIAAAFVEALAPHESQIGD